MTPLIATMTLDGHLILPEKIKKEFAGVEMFSISTRDGSILLTPIAIPSDEELFADIEVTEEDMEQIRGQLVKPYSEEVIRTLALADKIVERIKDLPQEVQLARFQRNVEAIRAEAIAKGTAIEHEWEAAVDD